MRPLAPNEGRCGTCKHYEKQQCLKTDSYTDARLRHRKKAENGCWEPKEAEKR